MMILSARMAPLLVALSFLYLLALIRPHYTHVLTDTRTSQEHVPIFTDMRGELLKQNAAGYSAKYGDTIKCTFNFDPVKFEPLAPPPRGNHAGKPASLRVVVTDLNTDNMTLSLRDRSNKLHSNNKNNNNNNQVFMSEPVKKFNQSMRVSGAVLEVYSMRSSLVINTSALPVPSNVANSQQQDASVYECCLDAAAFEKPSCAVLVLTAPVVAVPAASSVKTGQNGANDARRWRFVDDALLRSRLIDHHLNVESVVERNLLVPLAMLGFVLFALLIMIVKFGHHLNEGRAANSSSASSSSSSSTSTMQVDEELNARPFMIDARLDYAQPSISSLYMRYNLNSDYDGGDIRFEKCQQMDLPPNYDELSNHERSQELKPI